MLDQLGPLVPVIGIGQHDMPQMVLRHVPPPPENRGAESGRNPRLPEAAMFVRLTRGMMQREDVTDRDVEDFTKEYFNVLCGHIVSRLFRETRVPARFSPPVFRRGRYVGRTSS